MHDNKTIKNLNSGSKVSLASQDSMPQIRPEMMDKTPRNSLLSFVETKLKVASGYTISVALNNNEIKR
jgi:hypothetical protein